MKMIFFALLFLSPATQAFADPPKTIPFEQYLREATLSRRALDRFFGGATPVRIDPDLGYVENNRPLFADGLDGSVTLSTVQPDGSRTAFMYKDRSARIDTYGDSYTHCDQVNDGETWQEYLAAHLGEPIRNFGTGGHGVYQAYRRMVREEKSEHGAKYIVLYIWGDDSTRSLFRSVGWIVPGEQGRPTVGIFPYYPGVFKANVEMDLDTGHFVEKENLLSTNESQYHMTEPRWMMDHLKDDLALQLSLYQLGVTRDLDRDKVGKLAARLNFSFDWKDEPTRRTQAGALRDRYAQRATIFILEKARDFALHNGKKLLVVLNSPDRALPEMLRGEPRFDQDIVDFLNTEKYNYFDMNKAQMSGMRLRREGYDDYIKRYFVGMAQFPTLIGHYNPAGNHLFAYSIKDTVVDWLDPKPVTYASRGKPKAYEHQQADTEAFSSTIRVYSTAGK